MIRVYLDEIYERRERKRGSVRVDLAETEANIINWLNDNIPQDDWFVGKLRYGNVRVTRCLYFSREEDVTRFVIQFGQTGRMVHETE